MSKFALRYLKKSSAYLIDIYVIFDQIGEVEFKNEVKIGTGSSFPRHFGENQICGFSWVFWASYIGDTSMFGDDEISRSIGRPETLWTTAVDQKPNCYAPANRLRSR